jgi:hypothetical protein
MSTSPQRIKALLERQRKRRRGVNPARLSPEHQQLKEDFLRRMALIPLPKTR